MVEYPEAYIPLGSLRMALMDLGGALNEHLIRIEITPDRVYICAQGGNPDHGLSVEKVFEIKQRNPFEVDEGVDGNGEADKDSHRE